MVFIKIHVTFRWCIAQYKNADGRFQIQLSHHSRWKWIFKSHPTIELLPFWNFVACEISIFGEPFVESPLEPFISPRIIEKSDGHFRLCFLALWIKHISMLENYHREIMIECPTNPSIIIFLHNICCIYYVAYHDDHMILGLKTKEIWKYHWYSIINVISTWLSPQRTRWLTLRFEPRL